MFMATRKGMRGQEEHGHNVGYASYGGVVDSMLNWSLEDHQTKSYSRTIKEEYHV